MNTIDAKVVSIRRYEGVSEIVSQAMETRLLTYSIGVWENIDEGAQLTLGIKSTDISLHIGEAPENPISNILPVIYEESIAGRLLSIVKIRFGDSLMETVVPSLWLEDFEESLSIQNLYALINPHHIHILESR